VDWVVLGLGLLLWAKAVRDLAADARGGSEVSLGAAMMFGQQWLLGTVLLTYAGGRLLDFGAAWLVALGGVLYVARGPVHRAVKQRCLGRDVTTGAPAGPGGMARLADAERRLGEGPGS
jgi:hypothetical protein